MKGFVTAGTLALAFVPGLASAAEPVCLTQAEATSLVAYALPQAINGTAKRCSAVLPAGAFLRQHGSELATRYAGQKDKYWPQAKPAFMKTLGADGGDAACGRERIDRDPPRRAGHPGMTRSWRRQAR